MFQGSTLCVEAKVKSENVSRSVVSDSLRPYGLQPARLLCPWDSPDKNTRVDCCALLQGIFLTQGSNLHLLHSGQILYCLSYQDQNQNLAGIYALAEETDTYINNCVSNMIRLLKNNKVG